MTSSRVAYLPSCPSISFLKVRISLPKSPLIPAENLLYSDIWLLKLLFKAVYWPCKVPTWVATGLYCSFLQETKASLLVLTVSLKLFKFVPKVPTWVESGLYWFSTNPRYSVLRPLKFVVKVPKF